MGGFEGLGGGVVPGGSDHHGGDQEQSSGISAASHRVSEGGTEVSGGSWSPGGGGWPFADTSLRVGQMSPDGRMSADSSSGNGMIYVHASKGASGGTGGGDGSPLMSLSSALTSELLRLQRQRERPAFGGSYRASSGLDGVEEECEDTALSEQTEGDSPPGAVLISLPPLVIPLLSSIPLKPAVLPSDPAAASPEHPSPSVEGGHPDTHARSEDTQGNVGQPHRSSLFPDLMLPDRWALALSVPGAILDTNDREWKKLPRGQRV